MEGRNNRMVHNLWDDEKAKEIRETARRAGTRNGGQGGSVTDGTSGSGSPGAPGELRGSAVTEGTAVSADGSEELALLVYRSNLLGSDRRVCNWGGGNTSSKMIVQDFRGRDVEVMYVKGSGSDLATMKAGNFTGLRMDDIRPLFERDAMSDEEMVAYLARCMMDAKHPRASIETLLPCVDRGSAKG